MSRLFRGICGERVFRGATISALALLTIFFIGIVVSMIAYTDWDTFVSAILSREILFAIRLSLISHPGGLCHIPDEVSGQGYRR